MIPQPAMWSVGVDYLRLTHRRGSDDQYVFNRYIAEGERAAATSCPLGVVAEPWEWMGYQGERLGSVAWGQSDQGYILQSSGLGAWALSHARVAYTNVPRIDLQATLWYQTDTPGIAGEVATMALSNRAVKRGRPYGVRSINGHGAGDTCYVGKRGKKSKFLRIYDKWRESGKDEQYRHAWRFEAELTDEHARTAYGKLLDGGGSDDTVLKILSGYLEERGIELPILEGIETIPASQLSKDETTNERRLRWLRSQVRPTLDKMRAAGVSPDEIVQALGLTRQHVLLGYLHSDQ